MTGNNKKTASPALNRVIHEPARLQIVSYLAVGGREVSFAELSEKLGLTAGNLSVQLKRLEEAGYLSITKSFRENRPLTCVTLTRQGMKALKNYLQELELMIDRLKDAIPRQGSDGGGD